MSPRLSWLVADFEILEGEACLLEFFLHRDIKATARGEALLDAIETFLPSSDLWIGAEAVFEEYKAPSWLEHTNDFTQGSTTI